METQMHKKETNGRQTCLSLVLLILSIPAIVACGSIHFAEIIAEPVSGSALVDNESAEVLPLSDQAESETSVGYVALDVVTGNNVAEDVITTDEVRAELDACLAEALDTVAAAQSSAPASVVTDLELSLTKVYKEANPSVVYIVVPPFVSGSGFVYDEDGYIVTNTHVVKGGRTYEVVFANGEREEAVLVGSDVDSDLAVLKADALPDGVDPLPLAEQGTIQVGQIVVAIGNPFGEQGSMSFGIVSALDRSLGSQRDSNNPNSSSTYSLPGVIQTDAPINPAGQLRRTLIES